ncbi:MAG: putative metal-binding motif-containing protein [Myxococcota bacterium]
MWWSAVAGAATLSVGPGQVYTQIADAVDDAVAGDRVEVDPGVYDEPQVDVGAAIEIVGTGGSAVTTWRVTTDYGLRVPPAGEAIVRGFTVVPPATGHVAWVEGELVADDWSLSGASASPLFVDGGSLVLSWSALDANVGGHVFMLGGSTTIVDSTLTGGAASTGGAIFAEGDLTLERAWLEGNHADFYGGAVFQSDGAFTAVDSSFVGNDADSGFGGGNGGAVYLVGPISATIDGCTFDGNRADGSGGALMTGADASGVVSGSTFGVNEASYGGAVYLGGTNDWTIDGSTFDANVATTGNGGAIRLNVAGAAVTFELFGSAFVGNSAAAYGGALAATTVDGSAIGDLVLADLSFTGNRADDGGAMSIGSVAAVDLSRTELCANIADNDGGGIRVAAAGAARSVWANLTLANNVAAGAGGGMWFDEAAPATVRAAAFLGNTGGPLEGGALAASATEVAVTSTLFAYTLGGDAVVSDGALPLTVDWSAFYDNLAQDLPVASVGVGVLLGVDPALDGYGGACGDPVAPAAGSPLIDAGDPAFTDPDGSRADIGPNPFEGGGGPEDLDGDGVSAPSDCDDADSAVYPGATEVCDGADQDCDGTVDEDAADALTFTLDADHDGYGVDADPVTGCAPPPDHVAAAGDCDDSDASVFPGASEVCDGADQDCDGAVDDDLTDPWWPDADGDGFGGAEQAGCPTGPSADGPGDCDDGDAEVHPGAPDAPGDGIDADCDGRDPTADGEDSGAAEAPKGCGCAAAAGGGWLPAAGLALALRRRRQYAQITR